MKYKGINWFERNVEKLVVGVAGVTLLDVVVMQLMWQPNKVKVGGKELAPEEAMQPAELLAKELLSKMDSKDVQPLQNVELNLGKALSDGLAARVSPRSRLVAELGYKAGIGKSGSMVAESEYAVLTLPQPSDSVAASFRSTISPLEATRNTELMKILPAQQPFDKAAVSVEATFSGEALREALMHDPDGDGGPIQAIPQNWWRDPGSGHELIAIVGVQIEREVVVAADG